MAVVTQMGTGAGAGAGLIMGLVLVAAVGGGCYGSGDKGQGGVYRSGEGGVKKRYIKIVNRV